MGCAVGYSCSASRLSYWIKSRILAFLRIHAQIMKHVRKAVSTKRPDAQAESVRHQNVSGTNSPYMIPRNGHIRAYPAPRLWAKKGNTEALSRLPILGGKSIMNFDSATDQGVDACHGITPLAGIK
jgi:hypothetical protein